MGKFWKKALKIIAIVAVVVAIAWVAAPLLGAFGEAITAGISAVGEAIGGAFAAVGEALGISGAAGAAEGAAAAGAAAAGEGAATAGVMAGAEGAAVAGGELTAALGAEGAALTDAALAGAAGTQAAAPLAATGISEGAALTGAFGTEGAALAQAAAAAPGAVTQTAATGALGQIGAWVQKNPLVAATLLKGAGDFATSLSQDPLGDRMALEEWQTQRMSDSITGMGMPQYKDPTKPNVLRRLDGTPVFTNVGGVPNGALSKVMPGYGDPNYKPQPKPPGG